MPSQLHSVRVLRQSCLQSDRKKIVHDFSSVTWMLSPTDACTHVIQQLKTFMQVTSCVAKLAMSQHWRDCQFAQQRIPTLRPKVSRKTLRRARETSIGAEAVHCSFCSRLQLIQVFATGNTTSLYKLNVTFTNPLQHRHTALWRKLGEDVRLQRQSDG